ncbi:hypothetical protein HK102_000431, partial [Quaeritorhiza haematococci]
FPAPPMRPPPISALPTVKDKEKVSASKQTLLVASQPSTTLKEPLPVNTKSQLPPKNKPNTSTTKSPTPEPSIPSQASTTIMPLAVTSSGSSSSNTTLKRRTLRSLLKPIAASSGGRRITSTTSSSSVASTTSVSDDNVPDEPSASAESSPAPPDADVVARTGTDMADATTTESHHSMGDGDTMGRDDSQSAMLEKVIIALIIALLCGVIYRLWMVQSNMDD